MCYILFLTLGTVGFAASLKETISKKINSTILTIVFRPKDFFKLNFQNIIIGREKCLTKFQKSFKFIRYIYVNLKMD